MAATAILNFGVQVVSSDKNCSIAPSNICAKGDIPSIKYSAMSHNNSTKTLIDMKY